MGEYDLPDGVEATIAAEALVARATEYPSFSDLLDTTIAFRIGQMLEKLGDGYTVQEALLGKSVHLTPVLLTQTEIRVLRTRGGLGYVHDQSLAKETLGTVRESLWRLSLRQLLTDLGIAVGVRKDRFGKSHIIFVPSD